MVKASRSTSNATKTTLTAVRAAAVVSFGSVMIRSEAVSASGDRLQQASMLAYASRSSFLRRIDRLELMESL